MAVRRGVSPRDEMFELSLDVGQQRRGAEPEQDRKSTRLNSSHSQISYAVFCLKKKNNALAPVHLRSRASRIVLQIGLFAGAVSLFDADIARPQRLVLFPVPDCHSLHADARYF